MSPRCTETSPASKYRGGSVAAPQPMSRNHWRATTRNLYSHDRPGHCTFCTARTGRRRRPSPMRQVRCVAGLRLPPTWRPTRSPVATPAPEPAPGVFPDGGLPGASAEAAAGASAVGSAAGAGMPVSPLVSPAPEPAPGVSPDGSPSGVSTGAAAHTARDSVHSRHQSPPWRHIPAAVRRHIWQRDGGRCCYRDPLTRRRCTSPHLLQTDHLFPVAEGDGPDLFNLQLLCFAHRSLRHGHGSAVPPERLM